MTSIKVKFRPSATDGKEGSIYYQVIRSRAVRQIGTELRLFESEWDKRTASVRIYVEISDSRKKYLQAVAERIRWDCKCLQAVIARLERKGGNYTADDVAGEFNSHPDGLSLFHFMQGIIGQLKQLGRARTSETYASALASFMSFRNGKDLLLCELDDDTALLYEAWLKGRGNCPNTVSFYMRILRAVYNRAVEKGLAEQASSVAVNSLKLQQEAEARRKAEEVRAIRELAQKMDKSKIALTIKCGENGKVFGSVTSKEIAARLSELGFDIDKKKIVLKDPIKTVGEYTVEVRLMEGVAAKIYLTVSPEA